MSKKQFLRRLERLLARQLLLDDPDAPPDYFGTARRIAYILDRAKGIMAGTPVAPSHLPDEEFLGIRQGIIP